MCYNPWGLKDTHDLVTEQQQTQNNGPSLSLSLSLSLSHTHTNKHTCPHSYYSGTMSPFLCIWPEIDITNPWNGSHKLTAKCHFLLQGIFPTQGSNLGLPHCRQMLYHLSHQGSPQRNNYLPVKLHWVVHYPLWLSGTLSFIIITTLSFCRK